LAKRGEYLLENINKLIIPVVSAI